MKATALFVDGPCRLQKRVLTFDVQPPQTLRCGGATYTYSANQGIQYLNYVVKGGTNDTGAAGVRGERDVFHAWTRLQRALNKGAGGSLAKVNNARRRIRRAVR